MRKMMFAFMCLFGMGLVIAFAHDFGWGMQTTAIPTMRYIATPPLMSLRVQNIAGTGAVYVLVNSSTNQLTNAIATGTCIIIPATNGDGISSEYTFDGQGKKEIISVIIGCPTSVTNTVNLAGF